ncbi:Uma2 family endonuclease [Leptolyngbya cf. ectocarpi LEGE 11479]|uniref:Uma2 family endonuclease n=1 Tax=Leptolyngbya cf. ectocarpi LEGE 11479 TaxID=1828722 RepID=A0A929F5D5_LEPEC|nr:Uma2 family endonuclease [Leptolyngbya ectocarpi]MBE9067535.1 Uma2 family endonuclease [Leptolyngbya cf. ectocarpi LEGE 11479]
MVTLQLRQLDVPQGQRLLLHYVSWSEFEAILEELGEHRSTRIAYDNGLLEIMVPLPEHESDKEIIGDLLKALLEELDVEFLTLGSTTFKNSDMLKGIEPDQCFYIQNEAAVRGKKRLDLTIDPPPDLALEIDITSRTHPETYAALGVPELWRRVEQTIHIYQLQAGQYVEVSESPTFPGWSLQAEIPIYVEQSRLDGRNKTMRAFRKWVRSRLFENS